MEFYVVLILLIYLMIFLFHRGNTFTFCIAQKVTMLRLPIAHPCPPAQQPASRSKNSPDHAG